MKLFLLITIVLFFLVSPVYAQSSLSDATGLINRIDIQTSGHVFEIKLTSNFDLTNYSFDKDGKQLILYFDSGLENNLAELIIPHNFLSGNFTFYLNDQEFFPKIQSNEKINFFTLNFTSLGTNVLKISSTEYLSGLNEIVPINDDISSGISDDDSYDETSFEDYTIWIIMGGIVICIIVFIMTKFLKSKN